MAESRPDRPMKLSVFLAVLGLSVFSGAAGADNGFRDRDDPDAAAWSEAKVTLPPFPQERDLLEFSVGPMATSRFYVDAATLAVGTDGVVRYTLVIKTTGGAVNVWYEGIRCETGEYRVYATGRADGTWAESRHSAAWRSIENKLVNRHHAALSREYFCPQGVPINNPQEGLDALRAGRHPRVPGGVSSP